MLFNILHPDEDVATPVRGILRAKLHFLSDEGRRAPFDEAYGERFEKAVSAALNRSLPHIARILARRAGLIEWWCVDVRVVARDFRGAFRGHPTLLALRTTGGAWPCEQPTSSNCQVVGRQVDIPMNESNTVEVDGATLHVDITRVPIEADPGVELHVGCRHHETKRESER